MAINPTPGQLELHSPGIGPWFVTRGGSLPEPLPLPSTGKLAINLTLNGVSWLPPASGTLAFYYATPTRPRGIAQLRDVTDAAAFDDGSFVALFTLLPWVERRLDALTTANVPSNTNPNPNSISTRPIVRKFAMELTTPPTTIAGIQNLMWDDFVWPAGVSTPEDQAANLGLTWDGTTLGNGDRPMSDLYQPGQFFPGTTYLQEMLQFRSSTPARLWCFDHRGRPLDAGAVANWWSFIANQFHTNMWVGSAARTAAVNAGLVFHVTNANEGPFVDTTPARLVLTNHTPGSNNLHTASATQGVTASFSTPPTVDDLPQPLAAVLPDGTYASTTTCWPAGPTNSLIARDFARIAVMSAEHELVGQKRTVPTGTDPASPAARRAGDQDRASTAVLPGRALATDPSGTIPALLAGTDAVLGAATVPVGGGAGVTVIAGQADRDAGPLATTLAAGAVPTAPPTITATALDGGGPSNGPVTPGNDAVVIGQSVLVTATFPAGFTGAWVRVWPLGFDAQRGEHVRLDGGAAPIDGSGLARMVVPLPDGTVSGEDPPRLGLDMMVVTATAQVLFPDLRIVRPFPTPVSDPVDLADVPAGDPLLVCSTGVMQTQPLPNATVPSGSAVVAIGGSTPALIDRTTIPAAAFGAGDLINLLTAADQIHLTEPAFATQSDHDLAMGDADTGPGTPSVGTLSETGAVVTLVNRQPFAPGTGWGAAGYPYPGCERLEVVVSHSPAAPGGFLGAAVVGSTPLLREFHELPRHDQGHPSCPAAPEAHGNGVLAIGSASVDVAEYARDRAIRGTWAMVTNAVSSPIPEPNAPATPSLWMATLRTEAAGIAAEVGYDVLNDVLGQTYPFDGTWENVVDFLIGSLGPFGTAPVGTAMTSARRALDRRILASTYGACEGATAMVAAIDKAEDFVYIETPAFDNFAFGRTTGDQITLWQTMIDRMDAVPGLHVAICTPHRLMPGVPEPLQRIRDQAMLAATDAMNADPDRANRFVVFSPAAGPARALRMASTTVIVDDVIAIVGTTHLWRRGLSFDSSLAMSVLDESLNRGRSAAVVAFRTALMAAQLNIAANQLPLDPVDTIRTVRTLVERGGVGHLAAEWIRPPDPLETTLESTTTFTEQDIWNPDGSFPGGEPVAWLIGLQTAIYNDNFNP